MGLTLDEARYALRRALAATGRLGPESLPALLEEKRLLINRSGVVEFIADGTNIGEVGGLDGLKTWLLERRKLFELRDSLNTEIVPKGLLLMGIPGCGKSLAVKAIASYFQLPLYRVDMIEIFSGRRGKPESAFVEACKLMEDLVPAVLWFDEIEMGINSADNGGEQGRIFAFFLTWMQEKARGLFVAATANRIDLLPAEMIRKGRFDEVFFVDLPLDEERLEIFKIHLDRRGVDTSGIDLGQLTEFTKGWSGAEVEQCVVSAVTKARLTDTQNHRAGSGAGGGEDCAALAHDARADQSHSRMGVRARPPRVAPRHGALSYLFNVGLLDFDVLDLLPPPGVGDVERSVGGLNHRGVGVLAGVAFQRQPGSPVLAIAADRQVERRAAARRVIVDHDVAAVLEMHHVDARIRIGEVGGARRTPRYARHRRNRKRRSSRI